MTFQQASFEAAKRFLQTIVIVDNQASFGTAAAAPVVLEDLVVPDALDTSGEGDAGIVAVDSPSDAPLNATTISEAFASQGLVCSILKPTAENQLSGPAVLASERADVLVLDWEMADSGELATAIARQLLLSDQAEGGKLRLIAIYTGRAPLSDVRAAFKRHYDVLENARGADEKRAPDLILTTDKLAIDAGSARVVFLSKNVPVVHQDDRGLGVAEEDLPERLLTEFAGFAGGLLPNATLASIAEIRRRTHRMLARFDKSLDSPILTNRALAENKEDAEEIIANLILSELEGQVPLDHIAREFMGADSVKQYLKARIAGGLKPSFMKDSAGRQLEELDLAQACKVIEHGWSGFDDAATEAQAASIKAEPDKYREETAKAFHKRLYAMLGTVKAGRLAHERFAILSMMRRDITGVDVWDEANRPSLKLGSIISAGDKYWVCLTPICDCVRLKPAKASLLFTQLHSDTTTFEIVVPKDAQGASVAKLRTKSKEMQLVTLNFTNVEKGMVKAQIKEGDAVFQAWTLNSDSAVTTDYKWVGELKPMWAQRLVQNFAANLARVGFDENEWHRLQTMPSNG